MNAHDFENHDRATDGSPNKKPVNYERTSPQKTSVFYLIMAVIGSLIALFSHEIYYGIIREIFKAPAGKVWRSSGGPYSSELSIIFFIMSLVLGSFVNFVILPKILSMTPGLKEKANEGFGCHPMIVSFFATLAVLYFLGHYGEPFLL